MFFSSKIVYRHRKKCNIGNPGTKAQHPLICYRIHEKHLATLFQLFNLSDQEIEQLATFMRHTPGVHRNLYRLSDNIFQTAKMSQLLLIMEKGGANQCQRKSLDEINIDMGQNLWKNDVDDLIDVPQNSGASTIQIFLMSQSPVLHKQNNQRKLVPWTCKQKEIAKAFFDAHIKTKTPPKCLECEWHFIKIRNVFISIFLVLKIIKTVSLNDYSSYCMNMKDVWKNKVYCLFFNNVLLDKMWYSFYGFTYYIWNNSCKISDLPPLRTNLFKWNYFTTNGY